MILTLFFLLGPAYIFTSDLAASLFNLSFHIKHLHLEDVYLGLLATHLNANFIELYENYIYYKYYALEYLKQANIKKTYFVYTENMNAYLDIWNQYFYNIH